MKSKKKKAATTGKSKKRHFKPIPDTPENLAKALFRKGKKKKTHSD